jgi:hypothetical protein
LPALIVKAAAGCRRGRSDAQQMMADLSPAGAGVRRKPARRQGRTHRPPGSSGR